MNVEPLTLAVMQYRLRTLTIALGVAPPLLAGGF